MIERLAFGQCGDDDGDKADSEKGTDDPKTNVETSPPELPGQTLEEFGDSEFGGPDAISQSVLWIRVNGGQTHTKQHKISSMLVPVDSQFLSAVSAPRSSRRSRRCLSARSR